MRIRTVLVALVTAPAWAAALFNGCGLYTDGVHVGLTDAFAPPDSNLGVDGGDACALGQCVECPTGRAECDGNLSARCETDLQSSGEHCGACGHSCLGGACQAGQCQPVLIASIPGATELVVSGSGVAVTARTAGSVYFVPTRPDGGVGSDGGLPILVASGQTNINGPSDDGTSIYWANLQSGGAVGAGPRTGEGARQLVPASAFPESTVVIGEYVYWLNQNGPVARVKRQSSSGAGQEAVVTSSGSTELSLATNGSHLYWVDDASHSIYTAPVEGGTAQIMATVPAVGSANAIAVGNDGMLYVVARATASTPDVGLFRVSQTADGGTATLMAREGSTPGASRLATDDHYVYFTDTGGATVWRTLRDAPPLDAGVAKGGAEVVATAQAGVEGIGVDDRAIYWTVTSGLVRLAK